MNGYVYYPGCSLKGGSRAYEESILPVFKEIGMPLEELEDWNCCGACWENCPTTVTPSERIIRKGKMIIKEVGKEH